MKREERARQAMSDSQREVSSMQMRPRTARAGGEGMSKRRRVRDGGERSHAQVHFQAYQKMPKKFVKITTQSHKQMTQSQPM